MNAGLVSLDGRKNITASQSGARTEAERIGTELGTRILEDGGRELLAEIRSQQAADNA